MEVGLDRVVGGLISVGVHVVNCTDFIGKYISQLVETQLVGLLDVRSGS